MSPRTGWFLRQWRRLLIGLHIAVGLVVEAGVFPWISRARKDALIQWWARRLCAVMGVRVRVVGEPPPGQVMMVANHISWLDIFVLHTLHPIRFVSKADVRDWPIIGWLVAQAGTLFLERGRGRHAHRLVAQVAQTLEAGEWVGVFPEGTTSDGTSLRRFHASLFEGAVATGADLLPIALRYVDAEDVQTTAPAYIDDLTFLDSLEHILAHRRLTAEVRYCSVVVCKDRSRQEVARDAESAIRSALFPENDAGTQ